MSGFRAGGRRRWIAAGLALVVIATAVSFIVVRGGSSSVSTSNASTAVSPGAATALTLPGGASVTVPVGAVAGDGSLSAHVVGAPAAAPAGMALVGKTYEFEVQGTRLTGPVTLHLPFAPPSGTSYPAAALLAFYDTSTHAWTPIPAAYNAGTHMAVATTSHLSVWSLLSVDAKALAHWVAGTFESFLGVADTAPQPSCPHAAQAATLGIKVQATRGGLVKWCVGAQGANAVLKVADDRGFAVEVDYPAAWSVSRDAWPDLDTAVVDGVAGLLSPAPRGEKAVIVPGGAAVSFSVRPGASGIAHVVPSVEAFLVSAFVYGVDTLVLTTEKVPGAPEPKADAAVKAVQAAFKAHDCVTSLQGLIGTQVDSAAQAVGLFWRDLDTASSCLDDVWEAVYGAAGFIASFVVGVFSWLMDGLKLVGQGLGGALESAVYWQGYEIVLTSPAPEPVLGQPWAPDQIGYGQIRPTEVSNGGDPTGVVTGITWSSWGGSTATGTGISDYVPPGGIVAEGTQTTVTIVAFDPGTCDGKLMYQAVEWYFAQHGQSFDPGTYINICTGTYVGDS